MNMKESLQYTVGCIVIIGERYLQAIKMWKLQTRCPLLGSSKLNHSTPGKYAWGTKLFDYYLKLM